MATQLKHWIALTGAGLLVVALATLPPAALRVQPRNVLPEVERFDALDAQVRREVGVLQATLWSDSLSALALRTAEDGVAYGTFAGEASADALRDWGAALRDYVGAMSPRDDDMVVGVFLQPASLGQPEGLPGPSIGGVHTYVGVRDGTPYCLQVDPVPTAADASDRSLRSRIEWLPENGIGACRLFARYGMPGDRVLRWLEDGAARFALRETTVLERPTYYGRYIEPQLPLPGRIFGLFRPEIVDRSPVVGRCLAGHAEACASAVTSAEPMDRFGREDYSYIQAHSPLTHNARFGGASSFGFADQYFLADMEAAFGPDAFARFWTSDQDVPAAFEAAFEVDLGSWVIDWAQREAGVYDAGPGLRAGTGLASLLTLIGLGGLASFVGTRRRVA